MSSHKNDEAKKVIEDVLEKPSSRRTFLKGASIAAAAGSAALAAGYMSAADPASAGELKLRWQEF